MLLQDGQMGDGCGHKDIMPGGAAMGWTNKMLLILLIGSALCLAAIGLIARNTTWDGTPITGWATRTNAATTVNVNTAGGLTIRPIAP